MAKKAKAKKAKAASKKTNIKAKKTAKNKPKKTAKKVVKKAATKTAPKKSKAKPAPKIKATTNSKALAVATKTHNWQAYLAPLYDKVLLQKQSAAETSSSGLYLGEAKDTNGYAKAIVLAVGKGLLSKKGQVRPLDVKEGDLVLYSSYAGNSLKVENMDLIIVREEEILGVMEK